MDRFTMALICWILAWVFNAANNLILFRFNESVFARIRNDKVRHWFRGDYKNDIKKKGWPSPFWDGWHATKWIQWLLIYIGFGLGEFITAITFAIFGFVTFIVFYNFIFRRPAVNPE